MKKSWGMIFLGLCFMTVAVLAQGPCQQQKGFAVLEKGKQYTVRDCDSLYAVHPSLFEQYRFLYAEVARLNALDSMNADLEKQYQETMKTYDNMVSELQTFINTQGTAIDKFDGALVRADSLIVRSTANTDRAVEEIRKERLKGRLLMIGGILAGTVTGYLLGK